MFFSQQLQQPPVTVPAFRILSNVPDFLPFKSVAEFLYPLKGFNGVTAVRVGNDKDLVPMKWDERAHPLIALLLPPRSFWLRKGRK
jgi:hypothetical protein